MPLEDLGTLDMEIDITQVEKIPPVKPPVLTSTDIQVTAKPTAREMCKSINATVLNTKQKMESGVVTEHGSENAIVKVGATEGSGQTNDTRDTVGTGDDDEILEGDDYAALSFSSSIFGDGNDSFDARNVTLPSGKLNADKLMDWSLPTVNLSRILTGPCVKVLTPRTRSYS